MNIIYQCCIGSFVRAGCEYQLTPYHTLNTMPYIKPL